MRKENNSPIAHAPPFPKNYAEDFLIFDYGKGPYLFDTVGNKYLDFGSGIAVNSLGYGREDLADRAYKQMKKLIHISNLYTSRPALRLAERLTERTETAAVHFGNSGSEANEAALKYARLYAQKRHGPVKHKFLCFTNAFHGRTFGGLSCTPTEKYQKSFTPLLPGVVTATYNNISDIRNTLDGSFAAVIVEPLQGEGGLDTMDADFAHELMSLCRKHDILLILDEVQTGLGRTGYFLCSESIPIKPDIITLAKPLAAGLPLSATLIPQKVNEFIHLGAHGTTFGGGPVTTDIANAVLDIVDSPDFLKKVREKGDFLASKLKEVASSLPIKTRIKGKGLLRGLAFGPGSNANLWSKTIADIITLCRQKGLILLRSGVNVIRIAPPLIISERELAEGCKILQDVLVETQKKT